MATTKIFTTRSFFNYKNLNIRIIQQNVPMSQYPSYYISPIYKKEEQDELRKSGEITKYTHVPTKAAFIDQTCSYTNDPMVSLFTNYVMRHGKKALARELVGKAFEQIKRIQIERYHKCETDTDRENIELNPKIVFYNAVKNTKPLLELTGIKRGGVKYQVPVPLSDKKSQFIAMNWLITAAKTKERTVRFYLQLAHEFIDASNNTGRVVKRKQDLHKHCEANRAYAHYRWS